MRRMLAVGLKETLGTVILSCFIAGGVGAVTYPAITRGDERVMVSVNRTQKGDRLPEATALPHRQPNKTSSTRISSASAKRPPVGCDPAFSPIAEPARANIFKRCMT